MNQWLMWVARLTATTARQQYCIVVCLSSTWSRVDTNQILLEAEPSAPYSRVSRANIFDSPNMPDNLCGTVAKVLLVPIEQDSLICPIWQRSPARTFALLFRFRISTLFPLQHGAAFGRSSIWQDCYSSIPTKGMFQSHWCQAGY